MLPLLLKAELLFFETIGQRSDLVKTKMAVHGKFIKGNYSKSFLWDIDQLKRLSATVVLY